MRKITLIVTVLLANVMIVQNVDADGKPKRKPRPGSPGYEKVQAPVTGKWFRIVNGQDDVPNQTILEASRIFCGLFDLPLDYIEWGKAASVRPDDKAGIVVHLDGKGDGPSLLVAPEDGWANVGVRALKKDNPTPKVLEARLKKEIWRAGCYALGVGIEATPSVLRPIVEPKDLDASEVICSTPVITPLMNDSAAKHGLGRVRYVSYRQACREGWAPPPTNEAQRVFFVQAKAEKERGPTNPITIKPPKKK